MLPPEEVDLNMALKKRLQLLHAHVEGCNDILVDRLMLTLESWRFLVLGEVSFCTRTLPDL